MPEWLTAAGSAAGGLFSTIYQIIRDQHLTGAQREANAFSADQAGINRAWSSSEADIARQWQEDMYNKYESPQAMIRQYQDAGLNPALMYGGAGSPSPSFSAPMPSGSAASSVTPAPGDVVGALNSFAQLALLRSEIDLNKSKSQNLETQSWQISELTPVQVDEAVSRIRKNDQDVSESQARTDVLVAQKLLMSKEVDWYDRLREVEQLERLSNTNLNNARSREIDSQIENIKQDTVLKAAQVAVSWANKGLLDAETLKAYESIGLIQAQVVSEHAKADYYTASAGLADAQTEVAGEQKESTHWVAAYNKYNYDHRDGNRIWSRIAVGSHAVAEQRSSRAQMVGALGDVIPGM